MIKPIKLSVKNACQYRDAEFLFEPGITIVVGMNGQGKSNLTQVLLYFSLTGETPPKGLGGTTNLSKKDLVNWMSTKGYTELSFEYASRTYCIKRNLHNSSVEVKSIDDGPPVSIKQAEANAFMEEVTGITPKALYRTCFAAQRGLTKIIEMTHGERMAHFQQVFGTDKAENLREIFRNYLAKLPTYLDRTADIVSLKDSIKECESAKKVSQTNIDSLEQSKVQYEQYLGEWNRLLSLPTEQDFLRNISVKENIYNKAAADLQRHKESLGVEEPVKPKVPEPSEHDAAVYGAKKNLTNLRASLEEKQKDLSNTPEVKEPGSAPSDDLVNASRIEYEKLGRELEAVRQKVCPTCNRPHEVHREEPVVEDLYNEAYASYVQEKNAYTNSVENHRKQCASFEEYTRTVRHLSSEIDRLRTDISYISSNYTDIDSFSEDSYLEACALWKEYSNLSMQYIKATQGLKDLEILVVKSSKDLEDAKAREYISEESLNKTREYLQIYEKIKSDINTHVSDMRVKDAEIAQYSKQIEVYEEEQKRRSSVQDTINLFEKSREVLHKDNLQKRVMSKALNVLNSLIGRYLENFNKDFTAWISEDFDFRAAKADNDNFPATSLSGGEQSALALAYMLSMLEIKGSSIPLMVLDEPTDGLDTEAIQGFIEVLDMTQGFAEQGLFIIFTTHSTSLQAAKARIVDVNDI